MTLQEQYSIERKRYMDGEITHQEFYRWLGNEIGLTEDSLPSQIVSMLPKSTDPHLNDIPMKLWDLQDFNVRRMAGRAGMRAWSLSDTVCVLKCLAREIKDGQ